MTGYYLEERENLLIFFKKYIKFGGFLVLFSRFSISYFGNPFYFCFTKGKNKNLLLDGRVLFWKK